MQFDHERLEVYHVALDFLVLANDVATALPEGRAYLALQLQRASTSIVLNIAEGAGEFSGRDKARFYRMAMRSATECAAVLDACKQLRVAAESPLLAGREMLLRVVAMLVRLVKVVGSPRGSNRERDREREGER